MSIRVLAVWSVAIVVLAHENYKHDFFDKLVDNKHVETVSYSFMNALMDSLKNRFSFCYRSGSHCSEVFNTTDMFRVVTGADPSLRGLNRSQFYQASQLILNEILHIERLSNDDDSSSSRHQHAERWEDEIWTWSPVHLSHLLETIDHIYTPGPAYNEQCFSERDIFNEATLTNHPGEVSAIVVFKLAKGYCISVAGVVDDHDQEEFLHWIFEKYGVNGTMPESGLEEIMEQLGIGKHDHEHKQSVEDEAGHDHDKHADEPDHVNYIIPSRTKRNTETREEHGHDEIECYSTHGLWHVFNYGHGYELNTQDFEDLCPALIQQTLSKVCEDEHSYSESSKPSEAYGYGTLAVFIISLTSVIGSIAIPFMSSIAYQYVMMSFIALAVGTMAGDALLHLIPHALSLHAHDHSHDDEGDIEVEEFIVKMFVALFAIYGFFVFETFTEMFRHSMTPKGSLAVFGTHDHPGHGHSHIPDPVKLRSVSISSFKKERRDSQKNLQIEPESKLPDAAPSGTPVKCRTSSAPDNIAMHLPIPTLYPHQEEDEIFTDEKYSNCHSHDSHKTLCGGIRTLLFVVAIGDIMHNISDGLAIGAAFAGSIDGGISTSIAVLCHELPHELGDFALYLSAGLSVKQALLINLLCACTAFGGLYIGIAVGVNQAAREWIFAATAGMFLYIALVDMLPELKGMSTSKKCKTFLVQNVGLLIGIGAMFTIAVFEEYITV